MIATTFVSGVSSTMVTPAFMARTLDLVRREELPSAVALKSVQFNLSRIIGPAIAGLLFGVIGIAGYYFLNSVGFLTVIAALWALQMPPWSCDLGLCPRLTVTALAR